MSNALTQMRVLTAVVLCLLLAVSAGGCSGTSGSQPSAVASAAPAATPAPISQAAEIRLSIEGESWTIPWDEVRRVTVWVLEDGRERDVTALCRFTSGDDTILAVAGSTLYGRDAGSTELTVSLGDRAIIKQVDVQDAVPTGVWLYDETIRLPLALYGRSGIPFQMLLCADFDNGKTYNATAQAAWQAADPAVALVEAGRITALAAGRTTISARYASFDSEAALEVFDDTPDRLTVQVTGTAAAGGNPAALQAVLDYGDQGQFPANAFVRVHNHSPETAKVRLEGENLWVYGLQQGAAEITVSAFGLSATVDVKITE